MFNATPVLGKDKTRWPIGNATETKRHATVIIFAGLAGLAGLAGPAAWLADTSHHAGERLFMSCDEEAYWRGWEIIPLCGGLGRRYRDHRFNARRTDARHPGTLDGGL